MKGSGWPPHEPDAGHGVGEGSLLGRVGGHIALAQSDDLIGAGLVGDAQVGEVAGDLSGGWGAAWSDVASSLAKAGTKQTHGLELFGEGCIGLIIAGQDGFVLFGEAPVQRRQLRPVYSRLASRAPSRVPLMRRATLSTSSSLRLSSSCTRARSGHGRDRGQPPVA